MHDREKVISYISNTGYSFIFTDFSWSISPKVYFLWLFDSIYHQIIEKMFKEIARPKGKCKKMRNEDERQEKKFALKKNKFHLEGQLRGNLRDTKLMKYIMA